jgi:hypothetical protein
MDILPQGKASFVSTLFQFNSQKAFWALKFVKTARGLSGCFAIFTGRSIL